MIAGIVCEPYKVRAFKRKLKSKGFEFTVADCKEMPGYKLIRVKFESEEIKTLTKLCKEAQIDAKLSN